LPGGLVVNPDVVQVQADMVPVPCRARDHQEVVPQVASEVADRYGQQTAGQQSRQPVLDRDGVSQREQA
jgi:hypothetical protein